MLVVGLSVGALLERFRLVEWSKSSAGVGESAGDDKNVRPGPAKGVPCRSSVSGKMSCMDRRLGALAEATGFVILHP